MVVLAWTSSEQNKKITYNGFDFFDGTEPIALLPDDDGFLKLDLGVLFGVGPFEFFDEDADFLYVFDGQSVVFGFEVALRNKSYGFDVIDFEFRVDITLLDFIGPEQNLKSVVIHKDLKIGLTQGGEDKGVINLRLLYLTEFSIFL